MSKISGITKQMNNTFNILNIAQNEREIFHVFTDKTNPVIALGEDRKGTFVVDVVEYGDPIREKFYLNDTISYADFVKEGLKRRVFTLSKNKKDVYIERALMDSEEWVDFVEWFWDNAKIA
jgi:hypothetical protein